MEKILILNGPNLNMLGFRDSVNYGDFTLKTLNQEIKKRYKKYFKLYFYQSNSESKIIDILHKALVKFNYVVFNPGAFTHYSLAIRDAAEIIQNKLITVHLSDISKREDFRKTDLFKSLALAQFQGKKMQSYFGALDYILKISKANSNT